MTETNANTRNPLIATFQAQAEAIRKDARLLDRRGFGHTAATRRQEAALLEREATLMSVETEADQMPQFYDCGICGHWHPATWNGDCRDDANRFSTSQLEEAYGQEGAGWVEVPMPD